MKFTRALVPALVLLVLASTSLGGFAQTADHALVLEALQVLQTQYVDPINTIKALNTALEGMGTQLSVAGVSINLPNIPRYVTATEAKWLFVHRFNAAVIAASHQLTSTQLAYAAIRGMTDALHDSHTGFLPPDQNAERRQRQRGQAGFTGVGIVLLPKDGRFYVWTVIPGGPAEALGVQAFDRIMKINDISTGGATVAQVASMIRGPAGTSVSLTLQRPGLSAPQVITITRAPIVVPSIFRSEMMEGGVGYIRLYQFVDGTGRDVRSAVSRLLDDGMRVLVLDLRGNSGGYLHELDSVLDTLLPLGVPVYTEMLQGGKLQVVRTLKPPLLPASKPVIVLVDEGSASAAELLAAAIKESHRGVLVGTQTSGAVEASVLVDLSEGSALSITTFRLATGQGVRLEGKGVQPDVAAAMTVEDLDAGLDRQLSAAVRLAHNMVVQPTSTPSAAR